uniref:Uncharacterized protein n=1 Tax=Setaria italica TaxID=4555 RepID=K3XUF3_SETIT
MYCSRDLALSLKSIYHFDLQDVSNLASSCVALAPDLN